MLELSREMCLLFLFRLRHYVSLFDSISKLVHVGRGQKDTNDLTALCFYPLKFRIVFGLQTGDVYIGNIAFLLRIISSLLIISVLFILFFSLALSL